MPVESGFYRITAERAELPAIAAHATFHWDGRATMSPLLEPQTGAELDTPELPVAQPLTPPSWCVRRPTPTGQHAGLSLIVGEIGLVHSSPLSTVDWEKEAASLTFYLDPGLLLPEAHGMIPWVMGELVWVCRGRCAQAITLYIHPVLLIRTTNESLRVDRVEIVLHLHAGDPLLRHITLALQAAITAEGMTGRLYAESITNALAVHLLRRCAACWQPAEECPGGFPKPKLQRVTEYIEAHLAHELSLTKIATVAQMSPDHFARLFRQATGRTPHQYVIIRRIECAKRLLRDTTWPIVDISRQVGFMDQSYFTAVFRKHAARTPKAYRDNAHQ